MADPTNPDQRAARFASRQVGAFNHRQAGAAGLTDRQLEGRVARGIIRRPITGVYVYSTVPDSWRQRAMVVQLAHERIGVLSFVTAAAVHGLLRPSFLPHITVPPGRSTKGKGATVHRSDIPMIDRCWVDGFRVTTVSRTIVDLASVLDRPTLAEVVDLALCRRLATRDSVLASMARAGKGRRGRQLLREVLEVWTPAIEPGSPAEMRLVRQLGELGVDDVELQHEVFDHDGAFVARLDLAWPTRRKALEYDGLEAHHPRSWERDEHRYLRLRALGWDVEAATKLDLLPGEPRLPRLVESWLRAPASTSGTLIHP
jgi:hypothetical protein